VYSAAKAAVRELARSTRAATLSALFWRLRFPSISDGSGVLWRSRPPLRGAPDILFGFTLYFAASFCFANSAWKSCSF
jgi:hypothetical protein